MSDIFDRALDAFESEMNQLEENSLFEDGSTPWCHWCGSMTEKGCNCGPIAENS